ncbi:MAG: glycosyltransferase [Candidatus Heimdallarchaeota archaeon]
MVNLIVAISGSIYLVIILVALIYYFGTASGSRKVKNTRVLTDDFERPFVSIIVPTYNEERNIVKCLDSLKKLNYPNYEIIISDGGSTDKTIEIAQSKIDKVVIDYNVPPGWIGKNWGCYLGYKEAKGEYLLFVDADTVHKPESLDHFIKIAIERDSALLSLFPYQILEKWWESINTFIYFASMLTYGGRNSVNNPDKPNSYTASGQYMLFKRADYEVFGGHESLKGSIVEDLALARTVKTKLRRLTYIDGTDLVTTRMYPDSAKQCWNGWMKALFPGTKLTQPRRITGATIFVLWGLFAPTVIALMSVYATWPYIVASVISYIIFAIILFVYWNGKGKHMPLSYVFHPIGVLIFCLMLGISGVTIHIKKTATWRGREYVPDLYVGSQYEERDLIVGDTNRIAQLDTDKEIELDDQIHSFTYAKQKLPKKESKVKTIERIVEHR